MNYFSILIVATFGLVNGCSPTKRHLPSNENDVSNFPNLFDFHGSLISMVQKMDMCNLHVTASAIKICEPIRINYDALKSMKMSVRIDPQDPSKRLILKKIDSSGGEFLDKIRTLQRGTTFIDYKSEFGVERFVVKGNHVYGSVKHPTFGKFYITSCEDPLRDCQVLLQTRLSEGDNHSSSIVL